MVSTAQLPKVDNKGRKSCDAGMVLSPDGASCLEALDPRTIPVTDGRGQKGCTDGFVLNAEGYCEEPPVRLGSTMLSSAPPAPAAEDPRLKVGEGANGFSTGEIIAISAGLALGIGAPVAVVAARNRGAIAEFFSQQINRWELASHPVANDNAEPARAAANDNAAPEQVRAESAVPEAVNVEDLPPVDPRTMVREEIHALRPFMNDRALDALTDKVLARWNEVPASTREALHLWQGQGEWRQPTIAEPIPSRWLQMAMQEIKDRQPSFELAAYQHGAEARVVRFTPDGPSLAKEVAIPVGHVGGSKGFGVVSHEEVATALQGFDWYQRLPQDARERVVSAVADRALEMAGDVPRKDVVMTVGEMADAMERGGVPVEVQVLPGFPQEGDALPLPTADGRGRELPQFKIEDDVPRFATSQEEARLVAETEAKLSSMRLFKQRGPEGRSQDAARYLERWQKLSERERASFTRVAEGMGEDCHVGAFDLPPVTWLSSEASRDVAKVARRVQQINGEGMPVRDARAMAENMFINRDRAPSYVREMFGEQLPADPVNAATLSAELNISEADAEALLRNEAFKPFLDQARGEWKQLSETERRSYANQEVRYVAHEVHASLQQRGMDVTSLVRDRAEEEKRRRGTERNETRGAEIAVELPHVK